MIRRQRVWDFLTYRAFINLSKLLLVESSKTWIAWHLMPWTIRFDFLSGCSYKNLVSSLLSFWTSPTLAALAIYRTVIKPCVFCCFSSWCFYFSVVVISFFVVVVVAPLIVGLCTMTYVIFAPLYVGLLWALLYNHHGSLPSRVSGSLPSCWFSMKLLFIQQKKKKTRLSWLVWSILVGPFNKNNWPLMIKVVDTVLAPISV